MGLTAIALALIIAFFLLCIVAYRFRDPHRFNARKTVWETTGFSNPHDKID